MMNANGESTWNRGYRSIEQGQANTARGRCAQETQNSLRYRMSKFAENMPKMPKRWFRANLTRKQGENRGFSNQN